MIYNYIVDLMLGGLTGYVTNNIAIKMLFKKFRFLGGGVIAERYEEFIKNMSDLVEKDLINHKTLMNELNSEKFRAVLKKIITDTIEKELPNTSGHVSLGSLPNIDKSFENMNAYIESNLDSLLESVMEIINDKSLADIISEEQFNYIIEHSTKDVFAKLDKYESDINKMSYSWLSKQSLHSLVSERTIHKLTENIIDLINKVELSNYDDLVNKSYQDLLVILDVDTIIKNIEAKLNKMEIADFVNNSDNLSKELIKRVIAIINSKDGFKLLSSLIDNILDELENITMSLNQLIDDSFLNSLEKFILDKFPGLLSQIIELISLNSSEIESIVNATIDEELDKGIISRIVKFIKNIFISNLAGKMSVVEKIKASVEVYGEEAPRVLTNELITYLRSNSISQIIKNLRKEKIITSSMMTKLLQSNIKGLTIDKVSFIDEFLAKQVGEVFTLDLAIIKRDILPHFLEKYKNDYLYSVRFKDSVTKKFVELIDNNKNSALANFISESDIKISLNAGFLKDELRKQYPLLNYIVGADFKIPTNINVDFTKQWQEIKQLKLDWIYAKINNEVAFTNIEIAVHDLIQNNLKDVLKNNISAAAKNELSKSNPQEISAMVEEFMGKELKPINTFGAVLGAMMSLGYAWGTSSFSESLLTIAMTPLIYASAGIATNKIAIWMLFKPYTPWIKFLPFTSPFVGVVPAEKPKFAKNLSVFVKNKLLSDDSIIELYSQERTKAIETLSNTIANDNFAIIDVLLKEDVLIEKLTGFTFGELETLTRTNSEKLAILFSKKIKSLLEESLDSSLLNINKAIIDKLYNSDFTDKIHNFIEDKIFDQKIASKNKSIAKMFDNKIDILFENIADELNYNKLVKLANNYKREYKYFVSENSIRDLAGESFVNLISLKLVNVLHSYIDKDTIFKPITTYLTDQEFNPNNKLCDLFNGIFPDLLKKNVAYLLEIITKEIEENKAEIKANIKSEMWFGKSSVSPVVDNLIDNKLPFFLKTKEQDILGILLPILDYRLSDIGFDENTLKLDSLDLKIRETLNNDELRRSISRIAKELIVDISDMPLDELLKIINIKNLRDMVLILSPLLKFTVDQIADKIEYSSKEIASLSKSRVGELLEDITANIYYQDLLKDIDLNKELKRVITLIKSDEEVKIALTELIKDLLFRLTQSNDLYNEKIFIADVEKFINLLLDNDSAKLEVIISPFIKDLILNANAIIDVESKKELLSYLVNSVFESLGANLNEAINSIDIQKVVHDEINNMAPKEIEDLFNSFAKDYFSKLVLNGWIGAIPGLGVMIYKGLQAMLS